MEPCREPRLTTPTEAQYANQLYRRQAALLEGGILTDWQITQRMSLPAESAYRLVIDPFVPTTKVKGQVSQGLSSMGYDISLGRKFKLFHDRCDVVVDAANFDDRVLDDHEGDTCIIPPRSYALGESLEYFEIPDDVLAICLGKSTQARAALGLNVTPAESGWRGKLTIEIINHAPLPQRVHAGQGIGQLIFLAASAVCQTPYGRKQGCSYQNQEGLVTPRA